MSNQLQITGGAKVRNLNGVITGTTGVLGSVPLGAANGVATLDSGGKVPVSQLPASVVTYLGTWNAATNTPTLVNGTGDPGDLYICNVAGTVNFGAGPISFVVGDWVLYGSGTWQKSSGQNGTVTSVAVTETGDALTITGSPITTAGTINIGFAGTSAQYVAGNGSLVTFPSLTGYVPYTGATSDVDLGTHVLNAQALHVKGTAGAGHLGLKHQTATPTGSANESLIFADVNGNLGWQNDNLYLSTFVSNANTANRTYTLQNASGTLAFLSDIPSLAGYVTLATTQTISGTKTFTSTTTTSKIRVDNTLLSEGTTVAFKQYESGSLGETGYTSLAAQGSNLFHINWGGTKSAILDSVNLSTYRTYTLPNADGTLALTSDIPSLTGYVTLATTQTITGAKTFNNNLYIDTNAYWTKMNPIAAISGKMNLYAPLGTSSSFVFLDGDSSKSARFNFDNTANRIYTFPAATGTIALTSDIPSLSATAPISYSGGVISISQATTSTNGYLSSTDWNTFNNKQNALTNPVTGTGTTNYVTKFTGTSTVGNSLIYDNGTFVGINTTNPNAHLDVVGAIRSSVGLYFNTSADNALIWQSANQAIRFGTNDLERMRLTNAGSLGIGTTSPALKLDVVSTSQWDGIRVYNTSSAQGADIRVGNDANNNLGFLRVGGSASGGIYQNSLVIGTGGGYDIKIAPNGSLGLTVANGGAATFSSTSGNSLTSTSSDFYASLTLQHSGGSNAGQWNLQSVSGAQIGATAGAAFGIYSNTASAYRLYINPSGNIGIGTISPSYLLDVNGTFRASGAATFSSSVTAGGLLILNGASGGTNTYNELNRNAITTESMFKWSTNSVAKWFLGQRSFNSEDGFSLYSTAVSNNVMYFNPTGAATFSSSVTANSFFYTPSNATTGANSGYVMQYAANASSRSWKLTNDLSAYGDFGIAQSTTQTGSTYSYKFYIDPSGNIGIGTTSPSNLLHVSATSGTLIKLQGSSTGNNTNSIQGVNGSGDTFELGIANAGYSNATYPAIQAKGAYLYGAITLGLIAENGPILFQTAASERMRITSGGKVQINTTGTSKATMLDIVNNSSTASIACQVFGNGDNAVNFFNASGTYVSSIVVNSSSVAYNTSSDYRLKKDLKDFGGLNLLSNMKVYDFAWELDNTRTYGVIAHELAEILPSAVSGEKDGEEIQGVDYSKIVPVLVKAIQELKAEIDELKNK